MCKFDIMMVENMQTRYHDRIFRTPTVDQPSNTIQLAVSSQRGFSAHHDDIFILSIFACIAFKISGSGSGSIFRGFARGELSDLVVAHFLHSVPFAASVG